MSNVDKIMISCFVLVKEKWCNDSFSLENRCVIPLGLRDNCACSCLLYSSEQTTLSVNFLITIDNMVFSLPPTKSCYDNYRLYYNILYYIISYGDIFVAVLNMRSHSLWSHSWPCRSGTGTCSLKMILSERLK